MFYRIGTASERLGHPLDAHGPECSRRKAISCSFQVFHASRLTPSFCARLVTVERGTLQVLARIVTSSDSSVFVRQRLYIWRSWSSRSRVSRKGLRGRGGSAGSRPRLSCDRGGTLSPRQPPERPVEWGLPVEKQAVHSMLSSISGMAYSSFLHQS